MQHLVGAGGAGGTGNPGGGGGGSDTVGVNDTITRLWVAELGGGGGGAQVVLKWFAGGTGRDGNLQSTPAMIWIHLVVVLNQITWCWWWWWW